MKSRYTKASLGLLVVLLVAYLSWDTTQGPSSPSVTPRLLQTYLTSSTRSANVGKYCKVGVDRNSIATAADYDSAKKNMDAVNTELGIKGNDLIKKITGGNLSGAISDATASIIGLARFIGPFALGLIIFLFIWPFLCCCCCCPGCCPSKCCQKSPDEQYTKCELYWPTVTLILALLLTIASSVYGFINTSTFGDRFGQISCSMAIFTDDLLNGNVTADGQDFFVGLNQFSTQLTNLQTNLTNLRNNFTNLADTTGASQTQLNNVIAVRDKVSYIPQGGTTTGAMTLSYTNPIDGSTGSIASTFRTILGSHTATTSLVGGLYTAIDQVAINIKTLKDNAKVFSDNQGSISTAVPGMQTTINGIRTNINDLDTGIVSTMLTFINLPQQYGQIGLQGFYGFLIGFSFLALIGALLTACCNKYGCRYLMYFACYFLLIGGLISFIFALLFSILVPVFTWTCSYLDTALSTSTGFSANVGSLLDATTTNQISVCMPFGNGDLVSQVTSSAAVSGGINNLTSLIENMNQFNNDTFNAWLNGNTTQFVNQVKKYANGQVSDLDHDNNQVLRRLASPSANFGGALCTAQLSLDSWVPSNSQDTTQSTYIPCTASTNVGNTVTCSATLTALTGAQCAGCMDTTLLMTNYPLSGDSATLISNLGSRYNNAGTCPFVTQLHNIWNNYYQLKNAALGPNDAAGTGSVLARSEQIKLDITATTGSTVVAAINHIHNTLSQIKTATNSIITLVDPKYGLLAGLNCKVFGQDFQRFQRVICGKFYSNVYTLRLTIGIAAFGILFSMCCIVCTGVRHFKHMERLSKVGDAFFKGKDESQDALVRSPAKKGRM